MSVINIDIPFDSRAVAGLGPQVGSAIDFAIRRAAIRMSIELKPLMPKRSGYLRGSFTATVVGDTIRLEWRAPYAEIVDIGAGPHVITGSPFLYFRDSRTGQLIRKREVNHPGFTGRFYRLNVVAEATRILNEELQRAISRVRL